MEIMTNFMGHFTFASLRHRSLTCLKRTHDFVSIPRIALNRASFSGAAPHTCEKEERTLFQFG